MNTSCIFCQEPSEEEVCLSCAEGMEDEEPPHSQWCVCADCSGASLNAEND